jgi:hypothetical protein
VASLHQLQPPGRKMSAEIVKRVTSYNSAVGSADASPAASPASASRQDKTPKSPAAVAPPSSKEVRTTFAAVLHFRC